MPIAGDIVRSDGMLVFTHLTGHLAAGYGAAVKNVSMGCASRRGKLMMHSCVHPWIDSKRCKGCGLCVENCPEAAISLDTTAFIDQSLCIGCGECLTVCPHFAVSFSWKQESALLQKKMVEFALGVVKALKGRIVHFNILMNITKDCDCIDRDQKPVLPDIGILASTDPVAIDRASLDLVLDAAGKKLNELAYPKLTGEEQLIYAERVGLGTNEYTLVEVSRE